MQSAVVSAVTVSVEFVFDGNGQEVGHKIKYRPPQGFDTKMSPMKIWVVVC